MNFKLIDVSIHGHNKKQNVKVIADTENGITLNECQKLSQEISDIIFRKDLIDGEYRLDVSSPGLDKTLQFDYEFKRNIGRNLIVSYYDGENKLKEVTGEMIEYNDNQICLKKKEQLIEIKQDKIKNAKIKLKW